MNGEHGLVDRAELLWLDGCLGYAINLVVAGPDVLEANLAALERAQHIVFDVEADGASDGIGHDQRGRSQEGLLGVGVNTPVKVAVARKHGCGVEVALLDFLLDDGVQRTAHAVAGGAGKGHHTKAQVFQVMQQARLLQVQGHGLGAGSQRGLDPGLAREA